MASAIEPKAMTAAVEASAPPERPSLRAWYAVAVLVVAVLFGFFDRQILVLLVQPIKHDLSLNDFEIGETHGLGPAVFTAIAMFPLAWLADRFERRTVMCGCVIFWAIATALSGFAFNFVTLQACAIAVAVGEAAVNPIIYSLIPDLFPERSRARANIVTYGAGALGGGLGLAFAGGLIGAVGNVRALLPVSLHAIAAWRLAFFLVALPAPLVAIAVFLIGRTRREALAEQGLAPSADLGSYIKTNGRVVAGVFAAMAFYSLALQAMAAWIPVALIRSFHASAASIGLSYGLSVTAGAAVGLVLGVILTPYWRKVAGAAFVLRAICVSSAGTALAVLLLGVATAIWQAYVLAFCFGAIFTTGLALMPGLMQDIAPAALRARVIAAGTVVMMVLSSIGPPLVGFISDKAPGNPKGLMWAMVAVAMVGFLACAALARFLEAPYRRAVEAIGAAG